ncbi:unnamed protein product, partial [Aphanomyces euteiches]
MFAFSRDVFLSAIQLIPSQLRGITMGVEAPHVTEPLKEDSKDHPNASLPRLNQEVINLQGPPVSP